MPNFSDQKPLNIAFCITDLDPGGAEWALFHIVTRLDRNLWQPRVYCLGPAGELAKRFEDQNVPVICYGATSSRDVKVFFWLTHQLKEFKPILVQGFLFHANFVSRIAGYWAGVRFRLAGHRVAERQNRWHLWLERVTRRFVHKHLCVSVGVADFMQSQCGLHPWDIEIIPNGIDPGLVVEHCHTLRAELGLPADSRLILAVGRLHTQKGFLNLLTAFEPIANQYDNTHLLIVGEGPLRADLVTAIQHKDLQTRVTLLGHRNDVPELMSQADIFVLSSLWEGMPNVVLLAMQAGLPVIATAVEGIPDLIQNNIHGRIIKPGCTKELESAIRELLTYDELRTAFSENSKTLVNNEFTWNQISRRYSECYRSLLAGKTIRK